ncbi:hypothetical protein GCM10009727_70170 [Actinomadura napierensis]|uniref:Uncharacterized protein n=1 Tax=Actinomadura napierensis TaxID=267854 RepID=A0ABN3ABT3_9ACTN
MSRKASGALYSAEPGSSRSRNHNRCCANDNGNRRSCRSTGTIGGADPPGDAPATTAASPATVGWSNNSDNGTSTPSTPRIREITCVASSECPPSSKKLSSTPTRSRPKT